MINEYHRIKFAISFNIYVCLRYIYIYNANIFLIAVKIFPFTGGLSDWPLAHDFANVCGPTSS